MQRSFSTRALAGSFLALIASLACALHAPAAQQAGGSAPMLIADADGAVNVRDFGAVGDGLTDDTAAFAAAIDDGRPVRVSRGLFRVTSLVSARTGCVDISGAST